MKIGIRARRKNRYEEWPLHQVAIIGALKLLLVAEGIVILAGHGLIHVGILLLLWLLSYPVIHFGMCRKCCYYGRRCPVPGEGNLVHLLFKKSEKPAGVFGFLLAVLTYVMRFGYPVHFLVNYEYNWIFPTIYYATILVFFLILGRFIGCPNCQKVECPMNPDWSYPHKGLAD